MSEVNEPLVPRGSRSDLRNDKSSVDTVKDESAAVADTAVSEAKDIGHHAKDEAASVMSETKDELKNLYRQTRSELTDEAAKQQERVATGLHTIGDDFESMAANSEASGLAQELVRGASQRVGDAATWLSEREPGDVLGEVKSFARRQPGVFIGVAAIAGVVAGRLTRALASSAHDEQESGQTGSAHAGGSTHTRSPSSVDAVGADSATDAPAIRGVGMPVTDATPAPRPGSAPNAWGEEGSDERRYPL